MPFSRTFPSLIFDLTQRIDSQLVSKKIRTLENPVSVKSALTSFLGWSASAA